MTEQTQQAPLPALTPMFNALDRCDKCGAQAYMRARMPSGHSLLFCGHHGNEYRASLIATGAALDESSILP